jgi:hypothetical protein
VFPPPQAQTCASLNSSLIKEEGSKKRTWLSNEQIIAMLSPPSPTVRAATILDPGPS